MSTDGSDPGGNATGWERASAVEVGAEGFQECHHEEHLEAKHPDWQAVAIGVKSINSR